MWFLFVCFLLGYSMLRIEKRIEADKVKFRGEGDQVEEALAGFSSETMPDLGVALDVGFISIR